MNIKLAAILLPLVPAPIDCPQAPSPAPERIAATATNGLAIDLYRHLAAREDGNLFLSPYSILTALAMTAEGARAETLAEMRRALHLGDGPMADVHAAFAALQRRLVAGGGDVAPAVRARIAELRDKLAKANAAATAAERRSEWKQANSAAGEAHRVAEELNTLLATVDRYDLRVANSLFFERTAPLLPEFVAALERHYGAGPNPVDFLGNCEGSRRQINDQVALQTERRIQDLIPGGGVSADTRLVLANAVYFRGEWAEPFEASRTTDADFLLASGARAVVRLMRDQWRGGVPYAAFTGTGEHFATPREVPANAGPDAPAMATYPGAGGFQVIELPYKGGDLAMVVLLPQTHDGLPQLEQLLTAERLAQWLGRLDRREVDTALPRWRQRSECKLGAAMQALGMQRAFVDPRTGHGAQFAGMNAETDPTRQLFVGNIFHQAFVEVTEKGTEAAAATAVGLAVGSAVRPIEMVPFRPVFRADHPFLFLIRDTASGAILFVGRVLDPKA